jgi:BASS family bile acid:Na+ symporter
MHDLLSNIAQLALLIFLVAGMIEVGLGLSLRELVAPLKSVRLVTLSLAANFVIAPLLAAGLARLIHLDEPFAAGLMLLGLAPGAPFLPKLAQLGRGNPGFAAGLMLLLMVGTVIYLPILLPRVVAGAEISPWKIGRSLLLLMLLPMAAGLWVGARWPRVSAGWRPGLAALSSLSGVLVLLLIVALNFRGVLDLFGTGAILAGLAFAVLSAMAGWFLGGNDPAIRGVLALGTGSRNVGAALLVGAQSFKDPRVNVMVIVSALAGLVVLVPTARRFARRAATAKPSGLKTLTSDPG